MSNQVELSFIVRELGNANSEVMKLMQASRRLAAEAKQSSTEAKRLNDQQIRDLKTVVDNIERFDRAEKKSGTDFVRSMSEKANAVTKLAEAIHRLDRGGLGGELGKDLGGALPHAGAVSAVTGGVLGGNRLQVPTTTLSKEISELGSEFATLRATLGRFGSGMLGALGGVVAPGMAINSMISQYKEEIDKSRERADKWRREVGPLAGMGDNPQRLPTITEEIRNKAAAYGIPQEDIIQAMYSIKSGASHLPEETQNRMLDASLTFTKGKGANILESSKMFVAIVTAYQELAGDLGKASDLLGQATDLGKWTPTDLANYIPEVASVASAYQFPIEDLLAFLVAASKSSGKTEKTFTSARNILNKLPEAFGKGIIRPDKNGQFTIAGAVSQFSTDMIPFFGLDSSAVIGGLAANPDIFREADKAFENVPKGNAIRAYRDILKYDPTQRQAEINNVIKQMHEKEMQRQSSILAENQITLDLATNLAEEKLPVGLKGLADIGGRLGAFYDPEMYDWEGAPGVKGEKKKFSEWLRLKEAAKVLGLDSSDIANIHAAALTGEGGTSGINSSDVLGLLKDWDRETGKSKLEIIPQIDEVGDLKKFLGGTPTINSMRVDASMDSIKGFFDNPRHLMEAAGIVGTEGAVTDLMTQAYKKQGEVDREKNFKWYRDLKSQGLKGNALQAAVDEHYAGLGKSEDVEEIMKPITPEERMSARFNLEARRTKAKAAALRNQAGFLPWAKRGSFLEGVNADEREALQGIGKRYEKAMENTEWGISRKAQLEVVQEARDALVRRRVDMAKFGAKNEDELVEKMVLKMNDPNSFENKLKARTESMNKGVININAATINVTKANMGNAIPGAAQRNDEQSKQPGM